MNLQTKLPSWVGWVLLLCIVCLVLSICGGIPLVGIDILFFLAFGWIWFVIRVFPQVHIRWDLVASTAIYVAVFLAGSHFFLRWLYREMTRNAATGSTPADKTWRFSATLRLFSIIVLMFLVGMSAIGVAHQTAWIINSPEPLYVRSWHADQARCASNLKNIAAAMISYANNNGGRYPDDMRTLLISSGMTPAIVICPASNDRAFEGKTPEEISAGLSEPGHDSYLYFAKGVTTSSPDDTVLVTELLENHRGKGINVLYNDYHVGWLTDSDAERLLASLRARTAQTQPTTQP